MYAGKWAIAGERPDCSLGRPLAGREYRSWVYFPFNLPNWFILCMGRFTLFIDEASDDQAT